MTEKAHRRAGKKQLKIWLDTADHLAIKAQAEQAGLTVSDYVRTRCIKVPPKRRRKGPDVKELHRIAGQIGKIGSNLNQLAREANERGRMADFREIQFAREDLKTMTTDLARALGYGS